MNKKLIYFIFFLIFLSTKSYSEKEVFISHKIGNEIITNIDIENEANYLIALNNQLTKLTNKKILKIAKQSIIKETIKKIELLKFYELDQKNPYLDDIIRNYYLKINLKSVQEFEDYLNNYNLNLNQVKKKVEIESNWNQLIYDKYIKKININEDMLKDKIKLIKKLENKLSFLLSEIVFEIKKNKSLDDSILEINNSINEIGFKNTANLFSISESSKFGGNIGWIDESSFSEKISTQVKKLKVGEISDPIKLNNNFLLLKLDDIKTIAIQIDEKKEFKKLKLFEQNKQLNNFSKIYFNKIKINLNISEL
tara:strand:+ start:4616 stop:5545 length:930 start_codon:yes stop_codon:yes gene_type:complete